MGWTQVKRAYKYRFHPTEQQRTELLRTFGCVRKVYNLALDVRTRAWFTEQRRVNYAKTSKLLTEWKRSEELSYLGEVSSAAAADAAAPANRVLELLRQADSLPAVQVAEEVAPVGGIHQVGLHLARRNVDVGEDGRTARYCVVAAAACGGRAVHGDGLA